MKQKWWENKFILYRNQGSRLLFEIVTDKPREAVPARTDLSYIPSLRDTPGDYTGIWRISVSVDCLAVSKPCNIRAFSGTAFNQDRGRQVWMQGVWRMGSPGRWDGLNSTAKEFLMHGSEHCPAVVEFLVPELSLWGSFSWLYLWMAMEVFFHI